MFDRRLVQYFDWGVMGLAILIGCVGLLTLYSAVTAETPFPQKVLFYKQLLWFSVGLIAMVTTFLFNYKMLDRWAQPIYFACIALLLAVLFIGKYVGGSRRWFILGPVSLQPSELVKIAVIIALARYYSKDAKTSGYTLRELVRPLMIILLPVFLIGMQPDLGTAGLVLLIAGSITVFVKIERRSFVYLIGSGAIMVPLIWFFLKDYQKQRILTFLDPDRDPLGAGYHIIQSKIAIGSGGVFGKGWLNGSQAQLEFLPERSTDFIFAVAGEEFGLLGLLFLLILYLFVVGRGLYIAVQGQDTFSRLIAGSISLTFFVYLFVNTGMVTGLLPVVGVPLPLVSYGGTSMVTLMAGFGILMSIQSHRKLLPH